MRSATVSYHRRDLAATKQTSPDRAERRGTARDGAARDGRTAIDLSASDQSETDRAATAQPETGRVSRRALWAWARLLAGGAILALVLWRVGSAAFLDGLRVLDGGTLAVALGIGLVTTAGSAWRWCLVARGLGIRLPFGSAVADYYRAIFLNAALPGGVLGDVHRAVRHGRDVGDVGRGVRAVVLERTAGQLVLVTVSLLVLVTHPLVRQTGLDLVATAPPAMVAAVPPAVVAAVPLAVALIAAGTVGARVAARRRRGAVGRRRDAAGTSRWARALRTAGSDVRQGLLTRGNWPWIAFSSVLVLVGHLATFLVAARAAGASAPVGLLVPLLLLALLAMSLPLNIGGWGPREGVCAWAFGAAGLSAAQGLTVSVVYGLLAFVASLPGAAVLLARWLATHRPERRVASERTGTGTAVRRPTAWFPAVRTGAAALALGQAVPKRSDRA